MKRDDDLWKSVPKFNNLPSYEKLWKLRVKDTLTGDEVIYVSPFVSVCSGHHGTPRMAKFEGEETFTGEIIHSVKFKSANMNKMNGKRVLIVGIGNSAVDAADNLVTEGK